MPEILDTKKDFDDALKKAGDKLVVIDFYADWCGPCRMIAPKIVEMEKEFSDVVFYKVNVDDNNDTAEDQEVSAMPTFIFYKNGGKVTDVVGANEAKIREAIEKHK